MTIVTRSELCTYPNGTVFMLYVPDMTDGEIHIITGTNTIDNWNGELLLTPDWEHNEYDEKFCQWSTVDNATCDYDENQKFIVFSKTEVQQMINCLMWALTGCTSFFNEDIWIYNNTILSDSEMYSDLKQMK